MDERRRSPRFKVTSEVAGRVKATISVRILDVSLHGMLVESPIALPSKGACEVTVLAPSGEQRLRAEVRRCRMEMVKAEDEVKVVYRAGMEFPDAGEDGLDLTSLIAEICTVDGPINPEQAGTESAEGEDSGADDKGFKFAM